MKDQLCFKVIALIFFSLLAMTSQAQLHIGAYGIKAMGVGGPLSESINLEGKIFANTLFSDIGIEGVVSYELRPGSFHQFSVGAGFNVDLFLDTRVGIVFPVELEVHPLNDFRRLSLLIELAPFLDLDSTDLFLRQMIGVRYYFRDPD